MSIGLVKWYDPSKGFGLIGTPDEGDFFFLASNLNFRPELMSQKLVLIFLKKMDNKRNRNVAKNCRLIIEFEDWKYLLGYLGTPDSVDVEVEVGGVRRRGNSYVKKEMQSFSLNALATQQFFRNKNETEITTLVNEYFDNGLESKHFLKFCELIKEQIEAVFVPKASTKILTKIFKHFRENVNDEILFSVWKVKKFEFISLEVEDYEIPRSALNLFLHEIGISEFKRISNFSYGLEFCAELVNNMFSHIEFFNSRELEELYSFVNFIGFGEDQENKSILLDNIYFERIISEYSVKAQNLEYIKSLDDFNKYDRLIHLAPKQLKEEQLKKLKESIYEIVVLKCSEDFKPELWLKGIIEEAPFELLSKIFIDKETRNEKRVRILIKLNLNRQLELLKIYASEFDFEMAFDLLEEHIKKENSLQNDFDISKVLFDLDYFNDKSGGELTNLFVNHVKNESNEQLKYELFFKGYIKNIPRNLTIQNISTFKKDDFRQIFNSLQEEKDFIAEMLIAKVKSESNTTPEWIYELANEYLNYEEFSLLDQIVKETIEQENYFKLWSEGLAKIFPESYIHKLLNEKLENYSLINSWINNKAINKDEIIDYLFVYIEQEQPVTDRAIFNKQLNHLKYLVNLDETYLFKIKLLNNEFYSIILWFLDKENDLNFDLLKQKFIYFSPTDQVRIIRKLFHLKSISSFDLTVEKLNELTRFDLDLYETSQIFNSQIPIDISSDVIIKALVSFQEKNRFFVESDLFTLVLNDMRLNKTNRFKLSDYFERCLGRETAKYDWTREGEIKKIRFGNGQFYFGIFFSVGETKRINNRRGYTENFIPNPNFAKLKVAVRNIPGAKWNGVQNHWGVPSRYESEVLAFAKEQRFFLDFEGSNYTNNPHLANFEREEVPTGISFCEGRLAKIIHQTHNKEFWWCKGQACFNKCETIHPSDEWGKYTLLDFCEILGYNTDEVNRMGDHIQKGHYYQFIGLINRFNRLLDSLYCSDCNHILYPSDFGTAHFAAHTVVRFMCRNENCSNRSEIYLNHCLNGQCNSVIDSRVSKRCDNGLHICDNCGSCCSHTMLNRRLENLQTSGGYIHPDLIYCVDERLGHLERALYFCHNCKNAMVETSHDIFECHDCNIEYDTTPYNIKRPHLNLSTSNDNRGNDSNIDFDVDFDDTPF